MLRTSALDNIPDVEFSAFAAIERLDSFVEPGSQPTQLIDMQKELLADFVLGRIRQARDLCHRFL